MGTGDEQAVGIFDKPQIAHAGRAEDALDGEERVLDFGPYFRFVAVVGEVGSFKGKLRDEKLYETLSSTLHQARVEFAPTVGCALLDCLSANQPCSVSE